MDPVTATWSWRCDDEHERLGLQLILDRAGIGYALRVEGATTIILVEDQPERARALEESMLDRHATRVSAELGARLDRREQRGRHALAALVSVLAVLLGVAVLLRLY